MRMTAKRSKADLIIHPVRLRVLQALTRRALTAQQLASALPDIPQATLYRHLAALRAGEVITVVEERPVRGTVEKRYAVVEGGSTISAEDLAAAGREDHLRYFRAFIASL